MKNLNECDKLGISLSPSFLVPIGVIPQVFFCLVLGTHMCSKFELQSNKIQIKYLFPSYMEIYWD